MSEDTMRPGENPHSGDINGYRKMTDEEVAEINRIKSVEAGVGNFWKEIMARPDADVRWLAIAKTHFEEGFSALVRSIARPRSAFGG